MSSSSNNNMSKTNSVHVIDFSTVALSRLNPLGRVVRRYIYRELQSALQNDTVSSIVVTGGLRNFSAGADLVEFSSFASSEQGVTNTHSNNEINLIDLVNAIEASTKPVVAAIGGACLGGGLEVALACHYRVAAASSKTQLGLPEVHVGVIPGAGGTQRLPRLIGVPHAVQLILTGQAVSAKKALDLGLVDAMVAHSNELLDTAKKWAQWAEVLPLELRRLSARSIPNGDLAAAHITCRVASLSLPKSGAEGQLAALEAIRASFTLPTFTDGMQRESHWFGQTLASAQGKARRHAFFAVRTAQKVVAVVPSSSNSSNGTTHVLLQSDIAAVQTAVIGAGTMGSGIALVLLQTGYAVTLVDVSPPALAAGLNTISGHVEAQVARQQLTAAAAQALRKRLSSTTNLHDLKHCRLVVEAVVERLDVKQSIFSTLAKVTPPDCLLLSNTSTLDIDALASVLDPSRRALFAGWHFFSPAHVMKLVEIVAGRASTAPTTVALLQALTKRIRKIGVVVGNCDGFCGNRLLRPYSAETILLLTEDGASIAQVDAALLNFGMALGPFQMSDLAGNDVGYYIRRERGWVRDDKNPNGSSPPPNRPPRYSELADDLVSQLGRLGQKVGKGWYDYDPAIGKGRKGVESVEVNDFVRRYVTGRSPQNLSEADIIERVLYPLVNEGFKCLEEGIARCPSDIDVVYLYGYGWPIWRGGPMYWADHDVGLPTLLSKLQEFYRRYSCTDHYKPSSLLVQCVALGITVEEYYRQKRNPSSKM
jgi:3-hydroxyacyl-CoA dehydrogenase/enoyl-CoA hydratase/carnithine racemase